MDNEKTHKTACNNGCKHKPVVLKREIIISSVTAGNDAEVPFLNIQRIVKSSNKSFVEKKTGPRD